jgi:hypothetical protein
VDWLQEVGFDTRIVWAFKDVAIFSADRLEPFSRRPRRY